MEQMDLYSQEFVTWESSEEPASARGPALEKLKEPTTITFKDVKDHYNALLQHYGIESTSFANIGARFRMINKWIQNTIEPSILYSA